MSTNILVPLDGSALAEHALPTAVALVKQHGGRLELAVVHEQQPHDGLQDAPWNAMTASMQERYVTDKAQQLSEACAAPVGHALLRGGVAEEIVRHARHAGADLIVMTTRGRTGLSRSLAGSVADAVIREAGMPVLLLREPAFGMPTRVPPLDLQKILILDDGSAQARRIADAAVAVARRGVTAFFILQVVETVHAIPDPSLPFGHLPASIDTDTTGARVADARETVGQFAAELRARSGCKVSPCVVVDDDPPKAMVEFALRHEVDLIAMTTHGRGASRLVLSSVTDAILRSSNLPILALRSARAH